MKAYQSRVSISSARTEHELLTVQYHRTDQLSLRNEDLIQLELQLKEWPLDTTLTRDRGILICAHKQLEPQSSEPIIRREGTTCSVIFTRICI